MNKLTTYNTVASLVAWELRRMDLSKADVLVNELLERSDLQEVLNSVLDRQRPPQATAHSSSSEELRNLFRPSGQSTNVHQGTRYFLRKNLGSWNSHLKNRRCKIPNTNKVFPAFNKDLILLDGPDNATVVKQGKKHVLHEKGHILSAFEFKKEWDNKTVMEKIRQAFGSKIPDDVSLQFLMPCGNKLVIPQLTDNIELTALMIHKVYKQKSIYLMPSRKLFEEILENSDADNVDNTGFFDVDYSNNNIRGFSEEHSLSINTLPRNFTATRENLVQNDTQSSTSDLTSTLEESRKICLSEAYCEIPNSSTAPPHPTNYVGEMVLKNSDAVIEAESSMWSSQIGNETSDDFTLSTHFTYNRYVECLESDTQSDISEIHLAIQSSLQDQYNVELNEQHSSKEILQDLAQKINHMNTSKFNINRNNVWEGAVRGIRRSSFCPKNNISVKFSDDSGKSEEAVDLGGPRREFLRLLMRYIATSSLFEGTDCTKNLTLDSRGIRENWYFDTGRFISISLVHGGPSPGFFSETLYKSIAYGPETIQPSLDDVFDFEIASKIKKFADCSTVEELKTLINENLDFLSNAGCLRTVTVVNDKSWLVKDLLMFHVIHRVRGPFESLLKGLETLGVLQQIKLYPNSFLQLFCHKPLPLTADVIDNLFQIRFSLKGSNTFLVEQRIVSYWRDFLQDVEERQTSATLDGILAFATGADCTPPLGFEPSPSIEFLHSTSSLLPLANTCINCLKLPIHSNFTDFKSNMDFAFINTQGFGKQ